MDLANQPHGSLTSLQSDKDGGVSTSHMQDAESGVLFRIERVFPIRVNILRRKQAAQPPSTTGFQAEHSLASAASGRGMSGECASPLKEPLRPSVPLVSTLPLSEAVQSPNQRWMTNKYENLPGHGFAASLPPLAAPKIYRCEDEPIHIPGAIQRFGALIALKESQGVFLVRIVSDNSESVVGIVPEDLFGLRCFTDLLNHHDKKEFILRYHALSRSSSSHHPDVFQVSLTSLRGISIPLYCALHVRNDTGLAICEFELEQDLFNPTSSSPDSLPDKPIQVIEDEASSAERLLSTTSRSLPLHALQIARQSSRPLASMDLFQILSEIQVQLGSANELSELLDKIVGLVHELTDFHRVMVYQFDEGAAGSVVSEMVNPLASNDIYRGLHFPASDIPKQARDLYLSNKIRVLYNRDQETSRLICRTFDDAKTPLNLEHSYLRAMSPVHIKYLANMGVQASMSISLVVNQKLWGLISCHNYGAGMRISLPMREVCRGLGNIASSNVEKLLYTARIKARQPLTNPAPKASPFAYISSSSDDLLKMFGADFGFLVIKGEARTIGKLDGYNECIVILQYIRQKSYTTIFSSHDIGKDCPDINYGKGFKLLSGMLVVPLAISGSEFLVFLRRGKTKEVHWAGNPYKQDKVESTNYLEPRSSFKRWSESVIGTSREWTEDEVESATVLMTLYGRFIEVWRQKEAIVQRNRMTRLLIRNAGHEVRTPLNSIINYLEVALEEQLDDRAKHHLRKSLEASKSLVSVVNDLLHLTEAEAGSFAAYEDNVDLISMTSQVVASFKDELFRKGLEIGVQYEEALPQTVRCDPSGLRQVLLNLLANAIKNSTQGCIHVNLSSISTPDCDLAIQVSVKDEGVGLSEQHLDSIFRDFEQILEDDNVADPTDTTKAADDLRLKTLEIGLGLATVARFVRLNHGQIHMSSEGAGRGTTVSVTFPSPKATEVTIAQLSPLATSSSETSQDYSSPLPTKSETTLASPNLDEISSVPSSTPIASPDQLVTSTSSTYSNQQRYPFPIIPTLDDTPKLKILIAEDNPLNSRLLETRLSRKGHTTKVATDGNSCFEVFKKDPRAFDIILMDVQMPLLNGDKATILIREFESSQAAAAEAAASTENPPSSSFSNITTQNKIPIVAVSASLSESRVHEYIAAGFDGWILKPIDFKRLEAILAAVRDEQIKGTMLYSSGHWNKGGWFN